MPFVDVCNHTIDDIGGVGVTVVEDFCIARFPYVPEEKDYNIKRTLSGRCGARKIAQGWCKSSTLVLQPRSTQTE